MQHRTGSGLWAVTLSLLMAVGCIAPPPSSGPTPDPAEDVGPDRSSDATGDASVEDEEPPRERRIVAVAGEDQSLFEGERIPFAVQVTYDDDTTAEVPASDLEHFNARPEVAKLEAGELVALVRGTSTIDFQDDAGGELGSVVVTVNFGFQSIAAGGFHTCGLSTAGEAFCWGYSQHDEVGADTPRICEHSFPRDCTNSCIGCCNVADCSTPDAATAACQQNADAPCALTPVRVESDARFTRLSAGYYHTCGMTTDDRLLCWGLDAHGQLGPPDAAASELIVDVTPDFSISSFHVGVEQTCVVSAADGMVHCQGWNAYGKLGVDPQTGDQCGEQPCLTNFTPQRFGGSRGVAVLYNGTCGADERGTVHCVGGNAYGYFRDAMSTVDSSLDPVKVGGPYDRLKGAVHHLCGQSDAEDWECWGWNAFGQIDVESGELVVAPFTVGTYADLALGAYHTCGLTPDGGVHCWGRTSSGQIGRPTGQDATAGPAPIDSASTYSHITSGITHSCAIEVGTRRAHCWGTNSYGQLGIGENDSRPEQFSPEVRSVMLPP